MFSHEVEIRGIDDIFVLKWRSSERAPAPLLFRNGAASLWDLINSAGAGN